jgi:hypothetical protein
MSTDRSVLDVHLARLRSLNAMQQYGRWAIIPIQLILVFIFLFIEDLRCFSILQSFFLGLGVLLYWVINDMARNEQEKAITSLSDVDILDIDNYLNELSLMQVDKALEDDTQPGFTSLRERLHGGWASQRVIERLTERIHTQSASSIGFILVSVVITFFIAFALHFSNIGPVPSDRERFGLLAVITYGAVTVFTLTAICLIAILWYVVRSAKRSR